MFDVAASFSRQFTPVEGGYLYYPSLKQGGKRVTSEEYECLLANWKRFAGWRAWKVTAIVMLVLLAETFASQLFSLSDRGDWIAGSLVIVGVCGWCLWAATAPRRLVKGRPDVTPPRSRSQARKAARGVMSWPFIVFALLLSGTYFFTWVRSPESTLTWWAWVIGSGSFFALYLWTAFEKVRDKKPQ